MAQPIEDMLKDCTVKLQSPEPSRWGTGFFVGHQYILTCYHVIEAYPDKMVVQWPGQNLGIARVVKTVPRPIDLALLCIDPVEKHPPCVLLGAAWPEMRSPLYLYGYPDELPEGSSRSGEYEGRATKDGVDLIQFKAGNVRPGHSGSPLLNERLGRVCGIVRISRNVTQVMGGLAVPMEMVFQQVPELQEINEAFHQQDRRWQDAINRATSENSSASSTPRASARKRDRLLRQRQELERSIEILMEDQAALRRQRDNTLDAAQRRMLDRQLEDYDGRIQAEEVKLDTVDQELAGL